MTLLLHEGEGGWWREEREKMDEVLAVGEIGWLCMSSRVREKEMRQRGLQVRW